jgi:hypothetical protein
MADIIRKIVYFLYGKAETLVVIETSGITQEILDIVKELDAFLCNVNLHVNHTEYHYRTKDTIQTKTIHVFPSLKEYSPQLLEPWELIIE